MIEWKHHKLLPPDLLVSVRPFVSSKRWYEIIIWNGDEKANRAQLLIPAQTQAQATTKAIKAYLKGDF